MRWHKTDHRKLHVHDQLNPTPYQTFSKADKRTKKTHASSKPPRLFEVPTITGAIFLSKLLSLPLEVGIGNIFWVCVPLLCYFLLMFFVSWAISRCILSILVDTDGWWRQRICLIQSEVVEDLFFGSFKSYGWTRKPEMWQKELLWVIFKQIAQWLKTLQISSFAVGVFLLFPTFLCSRLKTAG